MIGRNSWVRPAVAIAVAVVFSGLTLGCGSRAEQSPRPAKIAFADDWESIFVMNPDGTGVTRIADGKDPNFSPDGSRIVVGGRSISTMNPDGGNVVKLADGGYDATYSADGTRIAFARSGVIYVMKADGSELKQLTAPSGSTVGPDRTSSQSPAFSPDGSRIVFTRAGTVWMMASDGTGARKLLVDPYYNSEPIFSPDGASIVFTSNRVGKDRSEIYVMDVDGDHIRPLTDDWTVHPSFSPDGTQILYTRIAQGPQTGAEIWVMNSDGTHPRRLTDPKQTAQHPSWGRGTDS
ncbi:PD40 domain-containing protein [Nocardia otitidiscaviarum]|uniref:PD40 domain-containing protein n=1 Tax=Nocardia otitidiscaviarum TaxID=1823 RepID=UPI001892DFCE|nr:PD40 domain-containing protein [Nocardia otitidiscaviarum]MBF6182290.1 PD40 domain-containing protein [Nocardia otitidiscaviarum]